MISKYGKASRVKEYAKEHNMKVAADVGEQLDLKIEEILAKGMGRARANGRKTIMSMDL